MTNIEVVERIEGMFDSQLDGSDVVERIEGMFDSQLDGSDMIDGLEKLQEDLIGADALHAFRNARHKAYQDAHPWLYPEIYGPVERPANIARIITPAEASKAMLEILRDNLCIPGTERT